MQQRTPRRPLFLAGRCGRRPPRQGTRLASGAMWLSWPALTITQRRVKPPTSISIAGTTVWRTRWRQFQRLPNDRHGHAQADDDAPERPGKGAAHQQLHGGPVRSAGGVQVDDQQRDQQRFDNQEEQVEADQPVNAALVGLRGAEWAGSAPRKHRQSHPAAPGRPCLNTEARCSIAAPADSPETRNSGPRMALFHSGRATIVFSRMPV